MALLIAWAGSCARKWHAPPHGHRQLSQWEELAESCIRSSFCDKGTSLSAHQFWSPGCHRIAARRYAMSASSSCLLISRKQQTCKHLTSKRNSRENRTTETYICHNECMKVTRMACPRPGTRHESAIMHNVSHQHTR